jgi:hypothetical protein
MEEEIVQESTPDKNYGAGTRILTEEEKYLMFCLHFWSE